MSQDSPKKLDEVPDLAGNDLGDLQLKVVRPAGAPQVQTPIGSSPVAQPVDHAPANSPHAPGNSQGYTPVNSPGNVPAHTHDQNQAQSPRPGAKAQSQLVDDDIASFFRNRQAIVAGVSVFDSLKIFIGKFIAMCFVAVLVFVFAWNHVPVVRVNVQSWTQEYFEFNVAQRMPAWTKKSKLFKLQNTTELGVFYKNSQQPGHIGAGLVKDPLILAVRTGQWPRVEASISARCPRWQLNHDCSLRAWYMGYRGMRGSLRALQGLDLKTATKLDTVDRVFFLFAMSQAATGELADQMFKDAIKRAESDKDLQRMIFDARFKTKIKDKNFGDLAKMVAYASGISAQASDLAKWRALDYAARMRTQSASAPATMASTKKQLSDALTKNVGEFKADPVAFLLIAGPALRLGLAKPVAFIAEAAAAEATIGQFDPTLHREISIVSARAHMTLGQIDIAVKRLSVLQKQLGPDAVSSHLLGASYLALRNITRINAAVALFQSADRGRGQWQSQYGEFLALTRSGRLAEAEKVTSRLERLKNRENAFWIKLALTEFRLVKAKKSANVPVSYFKPLAMDMASLYASHPTWPWVSELYAEALLKSGQPAEAGKVSARSEDLAATTNVLGSQEYLESPVGPYALMHE